MKRGETLARESDDEHSDVTVLTKAIDQVRNAGIHAPQASYPPALLTVLGIAEDASAPQSLGRIRDALLSCAGRLDPDDRVAFLEAAGFRRGAAVSAGARIDAAGELLGKSRETIYRYVKRATATMATMLLSKHEAPMLEDRDWVIRQADCSVDLRGGYPTVIMRRTIAAYADRVTHFDEQLSLPRLGERPLTYRTLEGCTLESLSPLGSSAWSVRLKLPHVLRMGTEHTFSVSLRLPDHDALEPLIGFRPNSASYNASIRIRFGDQPPSRIETFKDALMIGSFPDNAEVTIPGPDDKEFRHHFEKLAPGRGYGVRWTPAGVRPEPATSQVAAAAEVPGSRRGSDPAELSVSG